MAVFRRKFLFSFNSVFGACDGCLGSGAFCKRYARPLTPPIRLLLTSAETVQRPLMPGSVRSIVLIGAAARFKAI